MKSVIAMVARSLAAPVVFALAYRSLGARAAIAAALLAVLFEGIVLALRHERPNPIFLVAGGFTLAFGALDLWLADLKWFKLAPFAQNALLAVVFAGALATGAPILAWLASGLPESLRPEAENGGMRGLTAAWAGYFLLKALAFLFLAQRVELDALVGLRTVIGGGSLAAMAAFTRLARARPRRPRQA